MAITEGKSRIYMMIFEMTQKFSVSMLRVGDLLEVGDKLYDLIVRYDKYDALVLAHKCDLEDLVGDALRDSYPQTIGYAGHEAFDYISGHMDDPYVYRTTKIALHCYLGEDDFGIGDIDPWIHAEFELLREISSNEYRYMNGRYQDGSLMDLSSEKLEQYHKEWIGDLEKPKTVKDIFGILPKNTKYKTVSGHKINLGDYYEDYMDTCYIDRLEIDDDKNLTVILLDD